MEDMPTHELIRYIAQTLLDATKILAVRLRTILGRLFRTTFAPTTNRR